MATPSKVLFECQNMTLSKGTGIATYARNLASEAKEAGYRTAGLFGTRASILSRNPVLSEIQLFDAPDKHPTVAEKIEASLRWLLADPMGASVRRITRKGIVIDPGSSLFNEAFDEAYIAPTILDRAREHFMRYGRLMPISGVKDIDLFHTTHAVPLRLPNVPNICTIHDIIPLRLPYTTLGNKRYFYSLIRKLVDKLDHIVTVSEHSRRDLIEFFNVPEGRITNTYQSVAIPQKFLALPEQKIAQDLKSIFGIEYKDYHLFVGAIEPKKNIKRIVDAYAQSGSTRPLVLAGGLGWQYDDDVRRMNDERFLSYRVDGSLIRQEKSVRHLSYVPRMDLLSLLRGARTLIFPSIYEGFGLPVLEAMMLGTPVITSTTSSLPEVAGDAAILVDPYDVDMIANAIRTLDADDDLRADLSRRGPAQAAKFSPAIHRARIDALYRQLV